MSKHPIKASSKTKHPKEEGIFWYTTAKGEKLWMFRHTYYDSLGKRREKSKSGFTTDKLAIRALLDVKAQTLSGQTKTIESENMTVSRWFDIWLDMNQKKWKPGTILDRKNIIDRHIKPLIGGFKLQKLDRAIYQREFINKLNDKYKPSTIRNFNRIFNIAINAAVDEQLLTHNKIKKAILPESETVKDNFLNEHELKLLLEDIKQNENVTMYTLFLVLAYTGMRKGEAYALQWNDIDFINHTIDINKTRSKTGVGTPKTKNSYRTIVIDKQVTKQLETYRKYCIELFLKEGKQVKDDAMIFIDEETLNLVGLSSVNHALNRAIERAKIKRITPHGLRHTHATIVLNSNMNKDLKVKLIAERLGNSIDMIYHVYGHTFKELHHEVADIFSQKVGL